MLFYLKFFLKLPDLLCLLFPYYNIPRKIRELQFYPYNIKKSFIITYQEKLGNYNLLFLFVCQLLIITYQEKLGNYNYNIVKLKQNVIITYQEKLGNYNKFKIVLLLLFIITYQEKLGNYN